MWRNGIWIARIAGIGLAVVGVLAISGYIPSVVGGGNSNNMSMEVTTGHDQESTSENGMGAQMNNASGNSESSSISSDLSWAKPRSSDETNNQMSEMN